MKEYEDSARLGFTLILILCVFLIGFLLGGCAQELKTLRETVQASHHFSDCTKKKAQP